MKICLFTSVYALSETDKHAAFLVESNKHLQALGHEIHVFAPSYMGLKSHTVKGIPVHRFRYFFKNWENLTHTEGAPNRVSNPIYIFIALFYVLLGAVAAIRLCRAEKFDVIHVHWPFPHAIWGILAKWTSGSRLIYGFHGAELLLAKRFFFVGPCIKLFVRFASALMCNSTFTAKTLAQLTTKPIQVIPYGCSIDAHDDLHKSNDLPQKILFVGRIIERKGLPYLIRAMPLILKHTSVHLDVVGSGKAQSECELLSKELGISSHVTFHGVVSDDELKRLYSQANVFVLPSIVDDKGDTEGLGVVLVEALSFMTPVVASDVGGISDVIIHENTGLLVEQRSPEAIANAVMRILMDRHFARELSENGLKHAKNYFSWQRIAQAVNSLNDIAYRSSE